MVYTRYMITKEELQGKKIIIRADLDVPIKGGQVENTFRLESILPTIELSLKHAHRTLLIGHMGRPEGEDPAFSLAPVQQWLKRRLNQDIPLITSGFSPGEWWTGEHSISLLENLRFFPGENAQDRGFASDISSGADIYIYEAFASYHSCASMRIIPEIVPTVTGIRFDLEAATLSKVTQNPAHPTLLIASGAKADKLKIIESLTPRFDSVLLGGKFARPEHLMSDGLDLNQPGIDSFIQAISQAQTIVLNGPLGKYEDHEHDKATRAIFQALKDSRSFTVMGGGDTLAAIPALGFDYADFSFVSTGGGAMLEFLASSTHPLLEVLKSVKR
jgi:phosphoglycerate kinase